MHITEGVDEVARLQPGHLRHHHRKQSIRCDVERHPEKYIARALIELARQFAVGHIELEQAVARRQRHLVDVRRIPCTDDQAARNRVAPDHVDHVRYLVDAASVRSRPGSPLRSIDRAEIAIGVGPFVPDRNAVVFEIFDVGLAGEKPQQLVHDRLQRQLLRCQHRKSGGQIEAHLVAEDRQRAGTGAVAFLRAVGKDSLKQVVILVHDVTYEPLVQGKLTPDLPSTAPIRAGTSNYTRKNEYWAVRGQAQHGIRFQQRGSDQDSDSTKTSSRLRRSEGKTASTSRNAAVAISPADSGRVRNTVQSPREISSARRRFSSISGPSTIPSSSGAGSKSCLISQ